jgi:transcriptional regulator with XRE-family HTH domain
MMKDRIAALRKSLGLSQTEFGNHIGMTAASVSNIENGLRLIQERHIKLILAEFPRVNEAWLRTGEGDMFLAASNPVDSLVQQFSFPEICAKLLYAFDALAPDQQAAVLAYARLVVSSILRDDNATVAAAIAVSPREKNARYDLARLLNESEKSSSSPPDSDVTA